MLEMPEMQALAPVHMKPSMCMPFTEGLCTKEAECPFAHNLRELKPGGFKPKLCPSFNQGHCPRGAICVFAHEAKELPPGFKTQACANFKMGFCRKQTICTFAHGEEELKFFQGLMASNSPSVLAQNRLAITAGGLGGATLALTNAPAAKAPTLPTGEALQALIAKVRAGNLAAAANQVNNPLAQVAQGGAAAGQPGGSLSLANVAKALLGSTAACGSTIPPKFAPLPKSNVLPVVVKPPMQQPKGLSIVRPLAQMSPSGLLMPFNSPHLISPMSVFKAPSKAAGAAQLMTSMASMQQTSMASMQHIL